MRPSPIRCRSRIANSRYAGCPLRGVAPGTGGWGVPPGPEPLGTDPLAPEPLGTPATSAATVAAEIDPAFMQASEAQVAIDLKATCAAQ